jgi:hypothetical protein
MARALSNNNPTCAQTQEGINGRTYQKGISIHWDARNVLDQVGLQQYDLTFQVKIKQLQALHQ